jgi:hypothetical protein
MTVTPLALARPGPAARVGPAGGGLADSTSRAATDSDASDRRCIFKVTFVTGRFLPMTVIMTRIMPRIRVIVLALPVTD